MRKIYVLLMVIMLTITGCVANQNNEDNDNLEMVYKINFNSNGGSAIDFIETSGNQSIESLKTPTKTDFIFDGWYWDDETYEREFTSSSLVNETLSSDVTVFAKWKEDVDLSKLIYRSYLSENNPVVTITIKNYGTMELQLFPDVARNTVNNFISYIQEGSYDNSAFHRIIENFMIQGGIVTNTKCPIKGEFISNGVQNYLPHSRGVISMARTSIKDSATSQFFIVHKDSGFLDGEYASFGGLISGFHVLDALASVSTRFNDAPKDKVVIEKITVNLNGYVVDDVICTN